MAGCATPTGFAGHAGATANLKLTFHLDHSVGADHYGICRDTFYAEVRRGRLRALKLGKKTIVLKTDAEGWAKSLPALELAPAT